MASHSYIVALSLLCYPALAARMGVTSFGNSDSEDMNADHMHLSSRHSTLKEIDREHLAITEALRVREHPPRHISKSQSIAVIGAGPAGLHIARELQKRGFQKITILELTDRVGGKSYTRYLDGHDKPCVQRYEMNGRLMFNKSCITHEYGTCFLHNGYHRVRELIHEYNIRREARTANVISASSGFDAERFIDAEKEEILKLFGIHKEHIEVLLKAVATNASEHIEAAVKKVLKGHFLTEDAVKGSAKKTTELITDAVDRTLDALENQTADLAANLDSQGLQIYNSMNKANYSSYATGAYTMYVTKHVLKDEALRGRPAKETDVKKHFVYCIKRYAELREAVFGNPKFRMPPRLTSELLKEMSKSFRTWMVDHELQALIPFFQVAHAAQGYGYLWEVPAYYGLSWMSPDFVYGVMHSGLVDALGGKGLNHRIIRKSLLRILGVDAKYAKIKEVTTMVPEGYASIWREMHRAMKKDNGGKDLVHFNIKELKIDRQLQQPNAAVKVHWIGDDGETHDEEFDFLMYTGPLKFMERYVQDVQGMERDIFSRLTAYTYAITMYRTNAERFPIKGYTNDDKATEDSDKEDKVKEDKLPGVGTIKPVVLYNADNEVDGPRSDYKWFVDRNDAKMYALRDEKVRNYPDTNQRRMAGQFVGHESSLEVPTSDEERPAWFGTGALGTGGMRSQGLEDLKEYMLRELKADMKRRGVEDIQVLEQMPWPYFWHFNHEDIYKGRPWDLLDMQGLHKTWYLGASSSFESVNDVVNYNLMLLDRSIFKDFVLKHNSQYGEENDLDAFFDPKSICCCDDGKHDNQCTLVPSLFQRNDVFNRAHCPTVKVSHWPMNEAKEAEMKKFGRVKTKKVTSKAIEYLKLSDHFKSSDACDNLDELVILTADAYLEGRRDS